jgi:HPr kinase/phosphorylase
MLTGPSGSGKSDLALRLIDRGAILVSDDAVSMTLVDGTLMIATAPNIKGKIEIRGVGICEVEAVSPVPLRLVVELCSDIERMPPASLWTDICDFDVPLLQLAPFEASAPVKLEYAYRAVIDAGCMPVARNISQTAESNRR